MARRINFPYGVICSVGARLGCVLLLVGCALPETPAPTSEIPPPAAFDQQPSGSTLLGPTDLAHWWHSWHDPMLDALVRDALDHNTDIRIAQSHVAEARSLVTVAESALYPTIAGLGDAAWARIRWQEYSSHAFWAFAHRSRSGVARKNAARFSDVPCLLLPATK